MAAAMPGVEVRELSALPPDAYDFVASSWKNLIVDTLRRGGMTWASDRWAISNAAVPPLMTESCVYVATSTVDSVQLYLGWVAILDGGARGQSFVKGRYKGMGIAELLYEAVCVK